MQYQKYRDTMKVCHSGGTSVTYTYADEMDDIFGESRASRATLQSNELVQESSSSIEPAVVLCLLVSDELLTEESEETIAIETPKKRRRTTVAKTLDNSFTKLFEFSAKYYAEKMAKLNDLKNLQRESIDTHKELMLRLIEKL